MSPSVEIDAVGFLKMGNASKTRIKTGARYSRNPFFHYFYTVVIELREMEVIKIAWH